MPKYEYACKSCGEHLEVVQSFTDAPLTECPACGGPLRKVFHPAGILFKGSGFYATDSRAGAKRSSDNSKADGGEKAEKPAEKTPQKPAAASAKTEPRAAASDQKSA